MTVLDEISNLIKPSLDELNTNIYEITYQKEGKDMILRILVEKNDESNISLDDIVEISEKISLLLDEADIIKDDNYMLDVASAGAEHAIKLGELEKYINKYVNLHLINPIDGENTYEGTLSNIDGQEISLEVRIKTRTKTIKINRENVDRARLAIKF